MFRSSYNDDTIKVISKARESFYGELPAKLLTARQLARNEREATKDEVAYPPPTEVELRETRLKKERRWRSDERAWEFLKAGVPVEWMRDSKGH